MSTPHRGAAEVSADSPETNGTCIDRTAVNAVVKVCRDAERIEQILRRDGFDLPFPYFTDRLLRCAVHDVLAASPQVCFVVGEVHGEYAGFVFADTLGPGLWRRFARSRLIHHPFSIAWLVFRIKVVPACRRAITRVRRPHPPLRLPPPTAAANVPRVPHIFTWTAGNGDVGQVDILYVRDAFRGMGLASQMLRCVSETLARRGVYLIEAHVDETNHASLRAFVKAGWQAVQTLGGDYCVSCRPETRTPTHDQHYGNA